MHAWARAGLLLAMLSLEACARHAGAPVASAPTTPWQRVVLTAPSYDDELLDYLSTPRPRFIRTTNFEGPTPVSVEGAQTVTTIALRALMLAPHPPLLVDVSEGPQATSLPGAVWWPWAGLGTDLADHVQSRFAAALAERTGGDRGRALVLFCASKACWLAHNATVRAVALGTPHVLWYRGGRSAWAAAGLQMPPIR